MFASENGLKVTVEDAKCVQANAFLQAGLFQDFQIKEEQITFKVNLTVLLVCQCFVVFLVVDCNLCIKCYFSTPLEL